MIEEKVKRGHGRYLKVKNAENIYFCTLTNTFYLSEQVDKKRTFRSTKIKGEIIVHTDDKGKYFAQAVKGLGAAKTAAKNLRTSSELYTRQSRPTFAYFSDVTLEIQKTKSKRTLINAIYADKNLRPFFEKECPYLDVFEVSYEQVWARYKNYQAKEKPGMKLAQDRKYLIMVLRRAKKQRAIITDFVKGDFPLNEVTEPIGRALEDWEVKSLLEAALDLGNKKIYQQILIAVYMGLRKQEILQLSIDEINLRNREIDLDPKRLKTRKPRMIPVPIHDDIYPIIRELMATAEGKYLFPKINTTEKGMPVDWDNHQTDLSTVFNRVRLRAKVKCRFHDLRHTAITNMVAERVPPTTISKVMGASIDLINKIYDHLNKKTKEDLRELSKGRFIV